VVVLAVYLFTLAPEVTLGFSGIYSTGAYYAGIPHPPGFPLWTLYGWLFTTLLPLSNVAWRLSVSSAVAGALACAIIALTVSRGGAVILEGTGEEPRLPTVHKRWLRLACGVVAATAFGFHRIFWGRAVIVEPTALTMLLFSTTLCFLQRWVCTPEKHRYLHAAVLTYGLTLTVNSYMAAAAVGLPFIILFGKSELGRDFFFGLALVLIAGLFMQKLGAARELLAPDSPMWSVYFTLGILTISVALVMTAITRRLFTYWRSVCGAAALFTLSLSLYFYLPLASMTDPPMNWGYPRTVEGFFHTITRGQYEQINPAYDIGHYLIQVARYGKGIVRNLGLIYCVPICVLFFFLPRLHQPARRWILGLLLTFLALSLFMLAMVNPGLDRSATDLVAEYFIPSHMILALWAGYGLCILGNVLGKSRSGSDCPRQRASS
jgi:hypothetical protein